ncbi:hypothetical protein D8O27_22450 [Burkholderia mallei]|uniref:Uncharacterized protein n=2 Tax=Burkholderia mallei TaxID=13373 RepID=A0AAX1X363_BURML|nr:hypothetical protein BMA3065 [Burkholderia mallei ATCC 23344]RKO00496.1 hypothetical protein D8O31_07435 [Burkholderia mallei]RKO03174.1 hypothetical protein D8O03_11185 [Burkholderia mallei]RKO12329.1 hypothetical protein D8O04_14605 [Burkholderia mallei]RKO17690.1 hypothetical protein D8O30_20945 [Burkholderia mallei]
MVETVSCTRAGSRRARSFNFEQHRRAGKLVLKHSRGRARRACAGPARSRRRARTAPRESESRRRRARRRAAPFRTSFSASLRAAMVGRRASLRGGIRARAACVRTHTCMHACRADACGHERHDPPFRLSRVFICREGTATRSRREYS